MAETLKLSPRTKTILQNFSKVSQGSSQPGGAMLFHKGNTLRTRSDIGDVFGVAKIVEEMPSKFAVADLSKFLSIISLYDDPTLTVKDEKTLVINGGNKQKFVYTLANENSILTVNDAAVERFSKIPNPIVSFTLSQSDLLTLKKTATVANLPVVSIVADGKNIMLKSSDTANPTSDSYSATIDKTDKKFVLNFVKDKILYLMDDEYKVTVYSKAVKFVSTDIEYIIAPEIGSTYE